MSKYFFTIICILAVVVSKAQPIYTISKDGTFIAQLQPSKNISDNRVINVYTTKYSCFVASIPIRSAIDVTIESMKISENGALLAVTTNLGHFIYSTLTEGLISILPAGQLFTFSHHSNRYLVLEDKDLVLYNIHAQKLMTFNGIKSKPVYDMEFIPGDNNFLVRSSGKQYYLYQTKRNNYVRRFTLNDYRYLPNTNEIVLTYGSGRSQKLLKINLKNGSKIYNLALNRSLKNYLRDINKENEPDLSLINEIELFSTHGKYLIVPSKDNKNHINLLVIDTDPGEITYHIKIQKEKDFPLNYAWMNDSLLAIQINDHQYNLIHAPSGRHTNTIDTRLKFPPNEKAMNENKQARRRVISDNFLYVVIPKGRDILLGNSGIRQDRSTISNVDFKQFFAGSKYILLQKEEMLGYIQSSNIDFDLGTTDLTVNWLKDSCLFKPEEILGESEPPLSYDFPRFTHIKHISEADTNELKLVFQSVGFKNGETQIEFQILDKYGNYYTSATEETYRYLWCNLILKKTGEKPRQISDFTVKENAFENKPKLALSVVLDYSGSMGSERINALEAGILRFINSLEKEDGMSIVKYDTHSELQGNFDTSRSVIRANLTNKSYTEFGQATAMLDAINSGINNLIEQTSFTHKAIIVITDGNENSSLITKNRLILKAREYGIKVFTIGLGDFISESYLQSIAYNTSASYYRIYQKSDLSWIYEDVYNKLNNFYSIRFKTESTGKHQLFLKICPQNSVSDSLTLHFNNTPVDITKIDLAGDNGFDLPFNEFDLLHTNDTSFNNIPDLTDLSQIVQIPKDKLIGDQAIAPEVQQAFEELSLPKFEFIFDKTVITNNPEKELQEVVSFMFTYPDVKLEIIGHTDNEGSYDYNIELSENRADKVKSLLIERGIDKNRLKTNGKGDSEPLATNGSEEGRQLNRRVEFKLLTD